MSTSRKFLPESDFLESLHGPFFPTDIRKGQNISAKLQIVETEVDLDFEVWRLSPLGIELNNEKGHKILKGEKVNISLFIGGQSTQFTGLVVDSTFNINNREILGIRLVTEPPRVESNIERRTNKRWSTSNQFLPTGMAPNPAKYNDFVFFKVKDISSNGMQLLTSLRNKFILTGMKFDASISFPMLSQVRAKFTVKNIRITKEGHSEYLSLGVEFYDKTTDLMDTVGQYLSQFSDVDSLSELHREGLSPSSLENALTFSYVKTEQEYKEVLKLRHLANSSEGKIAENVQAEEMGDVFDTRSRIVIGKMGSKIVATGRMYFCEYDQVLENESYVQWDQDFPRRETCVEIMRLCTHPDFRGSDILVQMFRFMAAASAQSKREWIVLCSTEKYLGMYEKMGGKPKKSPFPLPAFNNQMHQLVIGNIQESILGKNLNPLYWNYIYGDLVDYLEDTGSLEISPGDRVRIAFYRMLKPFSNFLLKYYLMPKKIEKARIQGLKEKN